MSARKKFTNFKDYLTEFKLDTLNKLDKRKFDPIYQKKQILKTFQFTEKDTNVFFENENNSTKYNKNDNNNNNNTNFIKSNENSNLQNKRYDKYGFELDDNELEEDDNSVSLQKNLNYNYNYNSNSNNLKFEKNDINQNSIINSISFKNFKKLNPYLDRFDTSYMVVDDDERKNQGTLLLELKDNLSNEIENLLYQASNNQKFSDIKIEEGEKSVDYAYDDMEIRDDENMETTISKKSVRFNESDDSEASTLKTIIKIDDYFNYHHDDDDNDEYKLDSGIIKVKEFMKLDNSLQAPKLTDNNNIEYMTERKRDKIFKLFFNHDNNNNTTNNNKIKINKDINDLIKFNNMEINPIDLKLLNKDSNKLNLIHEEIPNVIIIPIIEKLKLYLNNNIDIKDILFNSRKIGNDWSLYTSWSIWRETKINTNNNKYISTYENIINFSTFNEMNQSLNKCELIFEKKILNYYYHLNNTKKLKKDKFDLLKIEENLINNENYYIMKHGLNPNKKYKPFNNKNLYLIKFNINFKFFLNFFKKLSKLIINYENYNLKFINIYEGLSSFQIKFKSIEIEFRLLITKEIYINRVYIIISELLNNLSIELINCINSIFIVKNDIIEKKLYKPFHFY